mmetsp:Transcript_9226/g.29252  ORF Transcript_9226/g.29252 Transcript_9226/m.29252 type:complete len:481 (-) Transcript_9226:223-1665(-)
MSLEFKKGFLSQPAANTNAAARSVGRRKQAAAPDEAYLPAESYDLLDDEDGTADPLVAEIETSEAAYEYSVEYCRAHCNQFNQGLMRLDPMVNVAFANDLRAVQFNRKMWGHHDGPGRGGEQRTMLLPSGIVLKYLEWGSEQAPPIVLLHDVCDSCHIWDDVAQPLADSFRVLALDLRGHGDTSRSPRHEYGIDALVEDLHEMAVRLSLNGRDWGGAFTRPWVLCGKGMGGAVAVAYAARHPGRVAGLMLWDYDPDMPTTRLCFSPHQAGHFRGQEPLAALLAEQLGLQRDAKYLAITFTNRCEHVDPSDEKAGCRFKVDPHFFLSDWSPGLAWTQLRAVAPSVRLLLVHNQSSLDWTYERAVEVRSALEQPAEGGEPAGVQLVVASRGTVLDEEKNLVEDLQKLYGGIAAHVRTFASDIDRVARDKLRAQGAVRYERIAEEELEAKQAEKEAIRQAAREAAGFMAKEDPAPPSFDEFDD